ncbi:MAG: hypothetical protein IJY36_07055 [Coprobacter sp.]|nr:hypothetical protein [Coprobacter sp.]
MKFLKYFFGTILVCALTGIFSSCLNDDDDADIYTSYSNTMVRTFALQADVNILNNLAYRYFTIDLVNGLIFNPDSLPYGTDISALVPDITFASASEVEITVYNKESGQLLQTIDYFEDDSDSIDFNNDVKMKVVASNGITTQNYRIKVLVHQVQADSLVWTGVGSHVLPSTIAVPSMQKTVEYGGEIYCFTTNGSSYSVGVADTPLSEWTATAFSPVNDTLSVASIVASADTLYALCGQPDSLGNMQLATSVDGVNWSATAAQFSALIGVWENRLLGVAATETGYAHASYTAGEYEAEVAVATEFPISGHSATLSYQDDKYGVSQIYFFGGKRTDGAYSSHIWAYDGERWAAISNVGLDGGAGASISPREGALFFAYYQDDYDAENDLYTRKPYYYILGGKDASGVRNDLYYTNTIGGYWEKAAQGTPLYVSAKGFEPRIYASACVVQEPANAVLSMSPGWRLLDTSFLSYSTRGRNEIVPYVYVFGGYDSEDVLIDEICRGVITRFTF